MRIKNIIPTNDTVPVIAVLEDREERIDWLKAICPHAHIVWSTNVVDFLVSVDVLALSAKLDLIILDHDLGDFESSDNLIKDKNGHDGTDACLAITVYKEIPVLIWSANPEMAPEMEKILKKRGFRRVLRKSFNFYKNIEMIALYIKNIINLKRTK